MNTINLLQENVGSANVYASDASREDYLRTVDAWWEILPPGNKDDILAKIAAGLPTHSTHLIPDIEDRYERLSGLNPARFVCGFSGLQRYFGAVIEENLVVFKHLEYGNAIYVMYESSEALSQRSRVELLAGPHDGMDRIVHRGHWFDRLTRLIDRKRSQTQ